MRAAAALACALLWGCRPPATAVAPGAALRVLHTNDLHCHIEPERADWIEGEPLIGGFIALDARVRALRAEGTPTLLLDGGDLLTGTPVAELEVDGARGGAMLRLMQAVGYDAWALGNHELDQGFDNAAALIAASPMPALSANVDAPGGGPGLPGLQDAVILDAGGLDVLVIGATTEQLTHLAPLDAAARLVVRGVAEAVEEQIQALGGQADLVVVLSHVGLEGDRALAEAVDGIDLIVGGHSHTRLTSPVKVGDTTIVQAGSYARSLGVVDLGVVEGRLERAEGRLVDLVPGPEAGEASPELRALVEGYSAEIAARYGEVLGEAAAALTRDHHAESDLGNLVTDALRAAAGADVALYNAGGLRADLDAGPITRGDLFNVLPFGNQAVVFELSGEELAAILTANARVATARRGSAMQVSGARTTYRAQGDRVEIVSITVGDRPLDPAATYRVASNTYVVERPEVYLSGASPRAVSGLGASVLEVVSAAVVAAGGAQVPERGRTVRVD